MHKFLIIFILSVLCLKFTAQKAISENIRSDLIETKFKNDELEDDPKQPGWMKRQLIRFGNIASNVSNKLGGAGLKVAGIIEKLCNMLKTIIPIVAAVCNVGQFQFCASADAPLEFSNVMKGPGIDLTVQD